MTHVFTTKYLYLCECNFFLKLYEQNLRKNPLDHENV